MGGYQDMFKNARNGQSAPMPAPPRLLATPTRSGATSMWDWSDKSVARAQDVNKNNMAQYNLDMQHARDMAAISPQQSGSGIQFGSGGGAPSAGGGGSFDWSGGAGGGAGASAPVTAYTNPYETKLNSLMDNPDSIANTGAYKFRFNQGQQALERSAAAKGMTGSGNTLAALMNYGQGQAAQAYGDERDALIGLVGGRNQFNLGQRGADTAAYTAGTGRMGTLGDLSQGQQRIGLATQQAQADDYWKGQEYKLKQQSLGGPPGTMTYTYGGMNPVQRDTRGLW